MSPRPVPAALLPWAMSVLGLPADAAAPALTMVAGDASNRRYFRCVLTAGSYILVEAPPATEKNDAFLAVRAMLDECAVRVPQLFAADLERGFLLLEDLGDQLLLSALDEDSVDAHYAAASAVLLDMAAFDTRGRDLGAYDRGLLGEELGRFPGWFVEALLGHAPGPAGEQLCAQLFARLIDSALEQPLVLVHRDFHSRNLMLTGDGGLAVIDFQDAVVGPVTYDLVSLLRDCYIQWPNARVHAWALGYRDELLARGLLADVGDEQFLRWFDFMGLQRHIKVLGTFARLHLRDGKPGYLQDLPRVIAYVVSILEQYAPQEPAFAAFNDWFQSTLAPLIAAQRWSRAA